VNAWSTPAEEAHALRRSAARAGCTVERVQTAQTTVGARAVGLVQCPDGWAAARMLLASALEDSKTAGARDLALDLRVTAINDEAFARSVHEYVKRNVRFVRESGEVFTRSDYTIAVGGGDCDDHARLVYALLRAGGCPARMAFLHRPGAPGMAGPAHVLAQAFTGGKWVWLETTVDAAFDEPPLVAAKRLGLLRSRSDIASEMRAMSEKDLPPVPAGFDTRTTDSQLAKDIASLQRMGYLADRVMVARPSDPMLRHAVLAFQIAHGGLTLDGLLGPRTRAAMGELAAVPPEGGDFTHAQAREVMRAAYLDLFGADASDGELNFALAVAWGESRYGRAKGQFAAAFARGQINWGSLEKGVPPCPPDRWEGKDGGNARCFLGFPSDIEAATALLRTWGKADTLAAARTGDATQVAAAMKRHGYFEADVDAYAALLRSSVRAVTGGGGIPDPAAGGGVAPAPAGGGGGLASAIKSLAVLGIAGGAGYWIALRA